MELEKRVKIRRVRCHRGWRVRREVSKGKGGIRGEIRERGLDERWESTERLGRGGVRS